MDVLVAKFLSKIAPMMDDRGCWEWIGSLNNLGYGVFYYGDKSVKAHRFSLMRLGAGIKSGQFALHVCDNRSCVNPDHLYSGTQADNVNDMQLRSRFYVPTYCPKGHEYTESNLRYEQGYRRCRECRVQKQKHYRERKRLRLTLSA